MGRIRLQVAITLVAVALVVGVVVILAFSVDTETVADYGGTYTEGLAGNPQYINPLLSQNNAVDRDLVALLFTGLTRPNGRGEIVPDLAERWEISPDGITYTFYLRNDVLWQDGAPFTARDVIYTITTIQHPEFQGDRLLASLWRTVMVQEVDSYSVRFVLREPYAPFLDYTTLGVLPAHILGSTPPELLTEAKFNTEPVGTGPYMLAELSARRVLLESNPNFYRERPYLERIEFLLYQDDAAVFEARRRGEIAGIGRVLPEYLPAIRRDDDLTLYTAPLSGYTMVALNLDRAVFQDPAVRQAMMWALDRQRLVDEILGGQGIVIHSPILPHSWAYDPDVMRYSHDVRRAVSVLEEAGWFDDDGDGVRSRGTVRLEFNLVTNQDPTRERLIEAISEQLATVGIKANIELVDWETLRREMLPLRRYDAILLAWQSLPPDPDPYPYWHSTQTNEAGLNFANLYSAEADVPLQNARAIHGKEMRYELYRDFQDYFARSVPSLLLYQPVYNYGVARSVRDVQVAPMVNASDRFRSVTSWYVATQKRIGGEETRAIDP